MNRFFLGVLLFGSFTFSINAQSTVSDFLLTAFEDKNISRFNESDAFLSKKKYRLPIVDEVEFRFGNDEFTQEDQQYALRLNPANPWFIRRNNALFNATRKELSIRKQLQYKENLYDRYQLAAEYLLDSKITSIQEERFGIIQKRIDIIGKNVESSLFDSEDLVDAKIDQIDELTNLEEQRSSLLRKQRSISTIFSNANFNWSAESLVSVSTIESISASVVNKEFSSPEIELISQQIDVVKKEIQLEKSDFNIGFAQVEYFPFRDRNSDYGVSFGVTLPIFRTNKDQIAELTLDRIELNNELQTELYQDSVKKIMEYQFLTDLIAQHKLLIEQTNQLNVKELTSRLSASENSNPLTLLNLKEGLLKIELLKLKSEERIIKQFLEFMDAYNVLTELPLTNYLIESLENLR